MEQKPKFFPSESKRFDIDTSQPILVQVGRLGPRYEAWVHLPVAGTPRFFSSPWLEALSRTPWWVVPLLWGPLVAAGIVVSLAASLTAGGATSAAVTVAHMGAGAVMWQLAEYSVHRWVFHAVPVRHWSIVAHFTLHGCHHKFPCDGGRLVFPPLPAAAAAAAVYSALGVCLPKAAAWSVLVGFVAGYLVYDCMHYAIHARPPPGGGTAGWWRFTSSARRAHMSHHYRDPWSAFGISSGILDNALRTAAELPGRRQLAVSRRAGMRRQQQLLVSS